MNNYLSTTTYRNTPFLKLADALNDAAPAVLADPALAKYVSSTGRIADRVNALRRLLVEISSCPTTMSALTGDSSISDIDPDEMDRGTHRLSLCLKTYFGADLLPTEYSRLYVLFLQSMRDKV